MKNVLFLSVVLLASGVTYAYDPGEKVLKAFTETFTQAENVKWEEYPDYYTVSFKSGDIQSKVIYSKEGVMLGAIRYYLPELLPLHIVNALKREYKKRSLYCVTEVTYKNSISYFIKMQDATSWYTLKVESSGAHTEVEKYRKA